MNRFRHLLLLALMGLITACSYNELPEDLIPQTIYEEDGLVLNVETRAETYKGQSLDQEYFVTAEDLENFVKYRRSATKRSDFAVKEVKSYGFDSSQTLFYILNYDQGWEVVAADKRVQPTLAHGDSGEFTMECDNEAMKLWMNMLADGILQTRLGNFEKEGEEATASDESKEPTDDPQSDHTAFWNAISPTQNGQTRFEPLTPTPGPVEGATYRYLVDTEVKTFEVNYGPLVSTRWGQGEPWNQYCPLKTDGNGGRALVGCVAVAGAQMLLYLQDFYDLTMYAPSHCFYSGNIDDYDFYVDLYQTDIWDNMAKYNYENQSEVLPADELYEYSAMLMAYVGDLVGMEYGNNSSGASTMNLRERVFSEFDISCSEMNRYSLNTIINNLREDLPVILKGRDSNRDVGHSWIVDGYHKEYTKTTQYYAIFDSPQIVEYLATLDKDDANYSTTTTTIIVEEIHMNWGWDGSDDDWYNTPPAEWTIHTNSGDLLCNTEIGMVYDFSPDN